MKQPMTSKYQFVAILLMGAVIAAVPMGFYHQHTLRAEAKRQRQAVDKVDHDCLIETTLLQIVDHTHILDQLQKGQTDRLIRTMEWELCSDIKFLHSDSTMVLLLSNTNIVQTLKLAAAYRKQHPYKTDDEKIDDPVEKLLDAVRSR